MHLLKRVWLVSTSVFFVPLLRGVFGALSWWRPLRFFVSNREARVAFFKCFQLNGALFLGSLLAMKYGVAPVLRKFIAWSLTTLSRAMLSSDETSGVADDGELRQQQLLEESADAVSSVVFHVLWLYPVYCISFILNATWYQEVADAALQEFAPKGRSGATTGLGFFKMIRDEIFRLVLVLGFAVQAALLGSVPGPVGAVFQFCCYCWLFSFYCFEYGWASKGWRLLQRTRHFERDWLFYLGSVSYTHLTLPTIYSV